ncbi:hypothetical protein EDD21DRAFT_354811 [Dissophora ornata]|nr:hypothetical protein EDD21DRAFT_354811 [Dissophora ornata]
MGSTAADLLHASFTTVQMLELCTTNGWTMPVVMSASPYFFFTTTMAHSSDSHVHLHPLLLPEILNVLGPFLQTESLLCSLQELQSIMNDSLHLGQNPSQGEAFAKMCERLETMHLISCTLGDWPSFEQGQGRFSKMKQLEFMSVNDMSAQLQMISQCPVLEDLLWWPQSDSSFQTQDFVHHLCLTRSTSCLKRLNLEGCEMPDADSAAIIAQLPASCNHLTFHGSHFGLLSIRALAAKTPQQPDFSLTLIEDIPSHHAHDLLSRCPNLQYLLPSCRVIATDLLNAPWIASRLVKLELTLSFVDDLPPELGHSVIYEQLSQLVSLQELCLNEVPRVLSARWFGQEIEIPEGLLGYIFGGSFDFSLENGMGVLASLSQLRRLDLRSLQVLRIGQPEALWMDTHWPALKSLYVRGFHHDSRQQREVLEFLGKRRPELDITIGRKG